MIAGGGAVVVVVVEAVVVVGLARPEGEIGVAASAWTESTEPAANATNAKPRTIKREVRRTTSPHNTSDTHNAISLIFEIHTDAGCQL